jgi:DNA mismatch repair protein MutL
MPIEALPPATVRAIGSTSVISDPCSVVKELIDNSLDAGSSSVMIEISSNTVDVIQLKDNGHGIPTEDHPYVCRHTYTSKIQTLDDLKNVGGMSFGFRGEALASVAEMSGCITITTRVASEIIGSSLKYERDGQLSQYVELDT